MIRVIFLTALVAATASAAHADRGKNRVGGVLFQRGIEWKRSGWTADAYLLAPKPGDRNRWVYKRIKEVITSGRLMPKPDPGMRRFFRDMTVFVIDRLRHSSQFSAYAHLLPATHRSGRFALLQQLGEGIPLEDLDTDAQASARKEIARIREAAENALPDVEIDVNEGNLLFDHQGRAKSLFDPAGGWWARLLGDRLREDGKRWTVDRQAGPFLAGNSVAIRISGGELKFGDAWLVVNLPERRAHVVKHGFKMAYEKPHRLSGERPLYEILGPPREDEREIAPGIYEQRFQYGRMRWDARNHTQVFLD